MAKQSSVNNLPATGAEAIFQLKEWLVDEMGFTVVSSSDGTTYNAAGDQITHAGTGANGMENTSAWFRIRSPGGREWTFQRTSTNTNWRVKVSALDQFGGGAPAATQTPSATDEAILLGAGTDASPTFAALFNTDGTYRWHMTGFDVAEDGVYPWYAWAVDAGTANGRTLIFCESLDPSTYPSLAGTRATPTTGEPDPCIYACGYSANYYTFDDNTGAASWMTSTESQALLKGWFAMNGSNGNAESFESWTAAILTGFSTARVAPHTGTDGVGPQPLSDEDLGFPIYVFRDTSAWGAPTGLKGACRHIKWKGTSRVYPDYIDVAGERWAYCGKLLLPFENGTAPL